MNVDYSIIDSKLRQFTKKYYLSKLLKGLLFIGIVGIVLTFLLLLLEYKLYLGATRKTILVVVYIVALVAAIVYYILLPLLGLANIRNKLSKKHMNSIIVNYFPEIKDQLWNLFEFNDLTKSNSVSGELILATIEQRINGLKHFEFSDAIQLKQNLKFLYIFLGVICIGTVSSVLLPELVKESGVRLLNFSENYAKPSPYDYLILNDKLTVGKGDDFNLRIKVDTDKQYENVYLNFGGNKYLMKQDSMDYYSYQFKTINNSLNLTFEINEYLSTIYPLNVLSKPILTAFEIEINKPKYTNLKSEKFRNITELVIPVGSECNFKFDAFSTDSLRLSVNGDIVNLTDNFQWTKKFGENSELIVSIKNSNFSIDDLLKIRIEVINDDYPAIGINQLIDSIDYTRIYFKGQIEDDYGFSRLNFVTKIENQIDTAYQIDVLSNLLQQDFFYAFNFNEYKGRAEKIEYYFEVFDNDAVNGFKSSISEQFAFSFPDMKDIFDYEEEKFENIEDLLSHSMDVTRRLQEDMMDLRDKMLNENLTDWERKEIMKNIYSKKKNLEEALKNIRDKNEELDNYMQSFTEQNEDLIKKQEQIQSILDEVMSDELKELMDEFNKMMEQFNEDKMNELTEQMDISLDDLSEQLDKNLELLKRMKIEKQLDLISSELDKHVNKQQELADKIDKGEDPKNLIDEQNKEKEALKELEKQYENLNEINEELEEPINLYDFKKEFEDIENEFNNSLDQQNKGNKKKSQSSMQKNKSNMQNLAFMMKQMKDAAFAEQQMENLADLLQILDNTIVFSFDQENLINKNVTEFDNQIFGQQKKLYQDFKVIKDSLYALAKREPSVDMAINKEIVSIENNFKKIDEDLTETRIPQAKVSQQVVLTSANNIALFLSEVIKNLQQQMASSMPGNQNCQKPGNNPNPNSSSNSMKSMQQSLQQQLEKMMQMMKDGQSGKMSGEMGKALSQQEKMSSMLQKMMNQGNVGSDAYETMKQAEQLLNQVREDILRNNLSNQTLRKNKEILTRLLEAENAENEREIDDKRNSETAEQQRISETAKQFENSDVNHNFKEKLIKQKLILNKYYQKKYQTYVNQLDSINGL